MQEFLLKIVGAINTYLSNYILLILLVGTGLFFTIKTRFVQVRCFGQGMKNVFGNIKLNGGKDNAEQIDASLTRISELRKTEKEILRDIEEAKAEADAQKEADKAAKEAK